MANLSSRMASTRVRTPRPHPSQVLLLLPLLLLATAQAQEGGTKSSFDLILEKFGFSGLPSPSKGGSRSPTGATAPARRPPQGRPEGPQATSFSQGVGQQPFRQQPSRIQTPRTETQRSQITLPQVGRPDNKKDALAALFNVARTDKNEAERGSAASAKQVLNDRAASPPLIATKRAQVSNNRIITNERASLRGRKQGQRPGPGRQGSSSAAGTNVNSAGLRGRNQPVRPGTGTQTSLRSSPQRVNEPTGSRNDEPLTSRGKQFDERLAQFGFQPRLLSNSQAVKNPAKKFEVQAEGVPPLSVSSLRQHSPAAGRSEAPRARGRLPGRPRQQTGGQVPKASALGSLQAIAAGNSLTVQNRGKGDQVNSPNPRPVPQIQTPFSQSRPSPTQSPSNARPQQPFLNPAQQRPNPTQQRPNFAQLRPNPPQARPSPSPRPGTPRSALDNLQSIAAGEGATLQVRNRSRGRRPSSPSRPPPRAAPTPIVPAFQQPQPPTSPPAVSFKRFHPSLLQTFSRLTLLST